MVAGGNGHGGAFVGGDDMLFGRGMVLDVAANVLQQTVRYPCEEIDLPSVQFLVELARLQEGLFRFGEGRLLVGVEGEGMAGRAA